MLEKNLKDGSGEKLRLGIIGLGKMGMLHWQTWRRLPAVAIAGIADIDSGKAAWARCKGLPFFSNGEQLIGQIDAAIIAVPAEEHLACALPLLMAGVHCLVEKPVAMNLAETQQLVSAAARHRAILAVGHTERFNGGVGRARRAITPQVRHVEAFRMIPATAPLNADVVQDLMVHDLDWVIAALGHPPHHVRVLEVRRCRGLLSHVRCELLFPDGQRFVLTASRIDAARRREVVIHRADEAPQTISLESAVGQPGDDPLTHQAHAYLDLLRGRTSAIATGDQALSVMEQGDRIRALCEEFDVISV